MHDFVLIHAALADENRLRLLHLLRSGERCVCQLQGVLHTNQPKISRHLAYLRKAGLVEARQDGKWAHYRLKKLPAHLAGIRDQTLEKLAAQPQIVDDLRRLQQINCNPARYKVPSPLRVAPSATPKKAAKPTPVKARMP